MAQRGEIRCAESQFALQSGRQEKPEKFPDRRHLAEEVQTHLPLFVFLSRHSQGLSWNMKRGFLFVRLFVAFKRNGKDITKEGKMSDKKLTAIGKWNAMNIWQKILIFCALLVVFNCVMIAYEKSKIDEIEVKQEALKAEVESNTSWGAFGGSMLKAAFDGLTLGLFTEEGIFEEAKKSERWVDSVYVRDAENRTKWRQAARMAAFFIIGLVINIVVMIVAAIGFLVSRRQKASFKAEGDGMCGGSNK